MERAARWGDGWVPFFSGHAASATTQKAGVYSMENFSEKLERLGALRRSLGRSGPFAVAADCPFRVKRADRDNAEQFVQTARELEARGANWIWTPLPAPTRAAFLENLAWFGEEIISKFQPH